MIKLVINGRFLRPNVGRSGVYRVGYELLQSLDAVLLENPSLAAVISCCVLVPSNCRPDLKLTKIRIVSLGGLSAAMNDTLWEQTVLPWQARGSTLLNFCNSGPVIHRDAFTMFHDAQIYSSPASYSRAFRAWYQMIQPLLGSRNRAILTVSQYSREQLSRYGVVDSSRVHVIHNGCDHVLRQISDDTVVQTAGLVNKRYVVALANTQAHKNIGVLFRAFHSDSLCNVTLVLFGTSTRADFEALGHRVPSNTLFLGRVSDEQLAGLLKRATALAFPSLTEGFGLPPLEAMALGCPTVVSPCGALPEVCGDAALWADPHEPEQWVKRIVQLCDEPGHYAEVKARGLKHAADFTWKGSAHRLLTTILKTPDTVRSN
ncbi:glycosyltransferase family 1 protein [soil metagenome]